MQQLLFLSMSILLFATGSAQPTEGKIIYERKVNMHKRIPKEDERMKQMMPEFNTSKTQLIYSGDQSIFSNVEAEENIVANDEENGNRLVIRMAGQDNEVYKNYALHKMTALRELGPRKYIIEDSLPVYKWQLKEETKIIKGYTCKKAVTVNQQQMPVIAWYTEQIPSASGPETWGGLPGMILEIDIDNAAVVYTVLTIENKLNKETAKAPTGGKKITNEEFTKMMKESMGPNGGARRVIIRDVQ